MTRTGAAVLVFALAACASVPPEPRTGAPSELPPSPETAAGPAALQAEKKSPATDAPGSLAEARRRQPQVERYPATGEVVDAGAASRPAYTASTEGKFTLNFKGAELREVIKAILGDLLKANYVVDDKVRGPVNLETRRPISRDELIPTLETLLRTQGAVLVHSDHLYQIVPQSSALTSAVSPHVTLQRDRGYQVLVVPLRFIAAKEMEKILKPLQPANSLLEVDSRRNLVMLAGTQAELAHMLKTIDTFDVDQLQGMSVGLFRLAAVDVKTIRRELEEIFGEGGAEGAGMLRFVPLDRLNAFLVITPQPKYLDRVEEWVKRLDRIDEGAAAGLHVYYVQNSRATHLAEVLGPLFGVEGRAGAGALPPARLAPGTRPAQLGTGAPTRQPAGGAPSTGLGAGQGAAISTAAAPADVRPLAFSSPADALIGRLGSGELDVGAVTIIADDKRNALIVKSTAADYAKIEQVIRKLDIWPFQVLVEVTIVDVELSDELSLGVEWFLKGQSRGRRAEARFDTGAAGLAPIVPGFSFTLLDTANNIRAVLNMLASESKLKVISSPTMMVLDNHKASIRVGDQVPVRTSEATGITASATSPIIASSIDYKDTGVLLEVTPRVNASGMVHMEIHQEVNDVSQTTSSGIDSPTINQRRINTTVAVQDGETVVLGGLIRDRKSGSEVGIPWLHQLPLLGWLFKSRTDVAARSELIVVITPSAVRDQAEARAVTDELRRRMSEVTLPDWLSKPEPKKAVPAPKPAQ
jgi:general secretion pathway protein D